MNAKSKSLKVFSWISIFFSLGIILIGISVIFNWYKYDETIFQTMPKAVPMPFISAFGFVLSGAALLIYKLWHKRISKILGLILIALGVFTLFQYLFVWDIEFDEVLIKQFFTHKVRSNAQMAPYAAFGFSIIGVLLLIDRGKSSSNSSLIIKGVLSTVLLLIGVLAFVGNVIDFEYVTGGSRLTKMTKHSAFGFIILGLVALIRIWYLEGGQKWIESSISRRLSMYIILPIMSLYIILATYSINKVKSATYKQAYLKQEEVVYENTGVIENQLRSLEEVARSTKRLIELPVGLKDEVVINSLKRNLENEYIHGSAAVFAHDEKHELDKIFAPYVHKELNNSEYIDIGAVTYDSIVGNHSWYEHPKNTGLPVWSEPFFDEIFEKDWMLIYSIPAYKDDQFEAVVAIDILLKDVSKVIKDKNLDKYAYGIISKEGNFIYTSYDSTLVGTNIYKQGDARSVLSKDREALADAMLMGQHGNMAVDLMDGDVFHTVYGPIGSTGWVFYIGTRQSSILAPVRRVLFPMIIVFLIILFLFVIIIYTVSKQLSNRILNLNAVTKSIALGNLSASIEIKDDDEIGKLSQNFLRMTDNLERRDNQLTELNEELESKVEKRTLDLVTEKLFSETFLDSLQAIFYAFDSDMKLIRWNKKYEELSGYGKDRSNNDESLNIGFEDDSQSLVKLAEQAKKDGFVSEEAVITDRKGEPIPYLFNGYKIEVKDELYIVGVGVDISELKQAQVKLAQNELEFNLLVSNLPGVVYRCPINDPMKIDFVNDEIEKLSGYPKEDFLGKNPIRTFEDIIHPDDLNMVGRNINSAIKNNSSFLLEYRMIHKNGQLKYVYEQGQAISMADGQPDFIVGSIFDDTDRKTASEALKDSERLFKSLVSNMPSVVYRCSLKAPWQMYYMSDEMENLSGYPNIDFVGDKSKRTYDEVIHPQDRNKVSSCVQKAVDRNRPFKCAYRIVNKDGQIRYVYDQGQAFYKDDGSPLFLVGTISDDTERNRLEKETKEQRSQLQKFLDVSPIGVAIAVKGKIKYVNESFHQTFGLINGDSIFVLSVDPNEKDKAHEVFETNGELSNFQIKLYDKNKAIVDVLLSTNRIFYKGEEALLGWVVNVSELKKVENELKEVSQEVRKANLKLANRMKQLYDMVIELPIATILFEEENNNVILNQKFTDLLGYDIEDLPDYDSYWKLFYPDPECRQEMKDQMLNNHNNQDGKIMKPIESVITDKSGQDHVVEIYSQNIGGFSLSMIVDMNEHKRFEMSLQEAKELADEANRSKSSFLANMSHEIRTPMNAVLGFSDLLEKLVQTDVEKNYLRSIKSSGKSLLTLINDILDLSKIEAGKMNLDFNYFNSRYVIEDIQNIFSLKIQEKGIDFIIEIDESLPQYIYSDEIRFRQILVNLVNNAIKFTEAGYVKITVKVMEAYTDSEENQFIDLDLDIEDTGIGISKSFMNRIFNTFTQQEGKANKKFGGTGLGLAISKNLAKMMNGDISVKSKEGKGTTFTLYLKQVPYNNEVELQEEAQVIDIDLIDFHPATVMIVDDIEDNRNYIKGALSQYGLDLIEAEDGKIAYDKLLKQKVDCILTDLRMPNMDGFELIEAIHANKDLKSIPIIATSASVMAFSVEKARDYNFDDFLSKPVRLNELISCLIKYLPSDVIEPKPDEETDNDSPIELQGSTEQFYASLEEIKEMHLALKKQLSMVEIEVFANKILECAGKFKVGILRDYGQKVKSAVDSFDVEKMKILINQFEDFIENLKIRIV
ncbi:MAG: PAS domain S-box protein [Carboxylicivirga sp.]|nr:PAS domain S-box protein [Carboxylicivirga sp.]